MRLCRICFIGMQNRGLIYSPENYHPLGRCNRCGIECLLFIDKLSESETLSLYWKHLKMNNDMDAANLKTFNLERALAGDPVVHSIYGKTQKVIEITALNSLNKLCFVTEDKQFHCSDIVGTQNEMIGDPTITLFMAPKEKTIWINLYPSPQAMSPKTWTEHETEEQANHYHGRLQGDDEDDKQPRFGNCAHKITITE